MKDELKNSLNKIFEHEKLGQKPIMQPRRKKTLLPLLITACLLIGLSVLTYALIRDNNIGQSTSTSSDRATLDHLQGEYVGNHVAVGEINQYILYDFDLTRLELKTKVEPYGMIIYADKSIPQGMKLKHAFYMFSLIQNVEYIAYETPSGPAILNRPAMQETYQIDFSSIKGDTAILSAYYTAIATTLPQIQTSRDDSYKYLLNALNIQQTVSDFTSGEAPDFAFTMDGEQYVLWHLQDEIYIVNVENPDQATLVDGKAFEDLSQHLTRDQLIMTGPIIEINDNQLLVSTGNDSDISYLVTVDDGKAYKVGDNITFWSTKTTRSIPAQATATKVKVQYE